MSKPMIVKMNLRQPAAIAALCIALSNPAWAHSEPLKVLYVANDGRDLGLCVDAQTPCKSLGFALSKAGEGDGIKVAGGYYQVSAEERLRIISGVIHIEGGFSRKDNFAKADIKAHPSLISGIDADEELVFSKRGFRLMPDAKGAHISKGQDDVALKLFKQSNAAIEGPATCSAGKAGLYACKDMDLLSHIPLNEFSVVADNANDIWGFADKNDNHEYALVGLNVGVAVIDITDPAHPREVGLIRGVDNLWRDVAIYQYFDAAAGRYKAYAYVTSEGFQGLQIIDMTGLPGTVSDAGTLSEYFTTAHTLYINTDYGYGTALPNQTPHLFIAGANANGGAFQILDLVDPLHPRQVFKQVSATNSDYMHDATGTLIDDERSAQCKAGHQPCEVLFDFNVKSLDIWDVTDKAAPERLSRTGYSQASYSHSGWYSADKKFLVLDDELDEQNFGIPTLFRTFDLSDLRAPKVTATYSGPTHAIDHNSYVRGRYMYVSHYRRGVVVLDVNDPQHINENAFFDTSLAFSDNSANFNGAWGVYPYLPSGNIVVSDIEGGLFVVKHNPVSSNTAPVAVLAQASISVTEGAPVTLSAAGSTDADGDALSFAWSQISGPTVSLTGANTASASFTAPMLSANSNLVFTVTVSDGKGGSNSKTATVTVNDSAGNQAPVAVLAQASIDVNEGTTVNMSASASTDANGDALTFAWTQTAGATVSLSAANSASASFTAPSVSADTTLQFTVTVSDGKGGTDSKSVSVQVKNVANDSGGGGGGGANPLAFILLLLGAVLLRQRT